MALLVIDQIHTFYGAIEALRGVSLHIDEGEIVTLIGANGAGKSTLLMTVCGTPAARSGHIYFAGEEITHKPTPLIMQGGVAVVPEGRRIFAGLTVLENLQMGGFFSSKKQLNHDLKQVFDLFPRLHERRHQRGGTLSGGEQQMLAIGRALMSRPRLLLLDEPSLGLAPLIMAQIFETLAEIRQEGTTLFLVEQNASRALQLADRGYVLENGQIKLAAASAHLLCNPEVQKAYLGG